MRRALPRRRFTVDIPEGTMEQLRLLLPDYSVETLKRMAETFGKDVQRQAVIAADYNVGEGKMLMALNVVSGFVR